MKNSDYNLSNQPNFPLDNNGKNHFALPQDYFVKFEDNLMNKLELEDELKNFPILSSIEKIKTFNVPENYFKSQKNNLEYKAELQTYFNLQSLEKPIFYTLEHQYSQELQASVNYKIELIDELNSFEKLYSVEKINPFVVFEKYFEEIGERVKNRIYHVNDDKTLFLDILLDFIFRKKMAFSFGLLFIVVLSIYFYATPKSILESSDCKTLACLERHEILNNNKIITNFDEEQLIDMVDLNSLNKQLDYRKEKKSIKKQKLDSINEDDLLDEL